MKDQLTDKLSMLLGMSYALNKVYFDHLNHEQKETFRLIENNIEELFYPRDKKNES